MEMNELYKIRHSAAHLLAHAVTELFPGTILTIGPVTQEGFFYDFLPTRNFTEQDLAAIEQKMREIVKKNLPIEQKEVSKAEARKLFKDNPFKLELINEIPDGKVGLSCQGDFVDMCKGNHVAKTGDIKVFKLLSISGSYWRADKTKQALQRISGTAFISQEQMDQEEKQKEEALKYDHRKLGQELDLFSFQEEGPGFPFYHPKGQRIFNTCSNYIRGELDADGYEEIQTPIVLLDQLWKQSGHYTHYKPNMYFTQIDDRSFALKPMNCPGCILVYKNRPRSYRELPIKLAEFGKVHRHELSGVLHGLFRVRAFTQDDGHVFCSPDQIEPEVISVLKFAQRIYKKFGFEDVKVVLATRPENAMGSAILWEKATNALKNALKETDTPYEIHEGDGAFYGPKIELHIKDSMGRSWQVGTIQVDFFMPENFELSFINTEGKKERPVMIHRAIYGSFERFLGVILEHFKGNLPFWLAPVQIKVLPIADAQLPYAKEVVQALKKEHFRVELDVSSDPLPGKIKAAQLERIPWMLVIGNKEVEARTVTLRHRDGKQEPALTLDVLIKKAHENN